MKYLFFYSIFDVNKNIFRNFAVQISRICLTVHTLHTTTERQHTANAIPQ